MKKIACAVLIFALAICLISPPASEARGGWWVPWAIIGGAAVLSAPYYYHPYYYAYPYPYYPYYSYYSYYPYYPYYASPPVVVAPPAYVQPDPAPSPQPSSVQRLFIYPRLGQSEKQQADDQYQCHRWAVAQTGYDPTNTKSGTPSPNRSNDYYRAMGACLDGRGYTMR
jgi:hypothetical protein